MASSKSPNASDMSMTPDQLCGSIKEAWCNLIFRRVKSLDPSNKEHFVKIVNISAPGVSRDITREEYDKLSDEEQHDQCRFIYTQFKGKTSEKKILNKQSGCRPNKCCNDEIQGEIAFSSEDYCELDLTSDTPSFFFDVRRERKCSMYPRLKRRVYRPVNVSVPEGSCESCASVFSNKNVTACAECSADTQKGVELEINAQKLLNSIKDKPRREENSPILAQVREMRQESKRLLKKKTRVYMKPDPTAASLICGVVKPNDPYVFNWWFIASEQLLHLYYLVMHSDYKIHPSFITAGFKFDRDVMGGNNYLTTNTYEKGGRTDGIEKLKERWREQRDLQAAKYKSAEAAVDETIRKIKLNDQAPGTSEYPGLKLAQSALEYHTASDLAKKQIEEYEESKKRQAAQDLETHLIYRILEYEEAAILYWHLYPAIACICFFRKNLGPIGPGKTPWKIPQWLRNVREFE